MRFYFRIIGNLCIVIRFKYALVNIKKLSQLVRYFWLSGMVHVVREKVCKDSQFRMRSLCISSHKYSFNCVCEDVSWCYAFPRRLRQQRPCCIWHSSQMASFSKVALQKHKLQSDSCLVKWQTLKVDQKYNIWYTHTEVTSHLKPTFWINFLCCMLNWFKLNI